MRPYDELTRRGQSRRLAAVARAALVEHHGLEPRSMRLVGRHSLNAFFRAELEGRAPLAVRVGHLIDVFSDQATEVEAAWLAAIAGETDLDVARVLTALDGSASTLVDLEGAGGPRRCTVFTWLGGPPLGGDCTPAEVTRAGRLLAELHHHAASLDPVGRGWPVEAVRADRAVRFGPDDLLREAAHRDRGVVAEALDVVDAALTELWSEPDACLQLLHGDYGPHNVMTLRGRLTPIDFQDVLYGRRAQDLGITISDLEWHRPGLVDAFRHGYESAHAWPARWDDLHLVFGLQRSLDVINLGLLLPHSGFATVVGRHRARLGDLLDRT